MPPEAASAWALAVAATMVVALILYTLTGGADFGGGVWDLLASGPRKRAQRQLVAHAIAPIWEANHVWLILVVVLLFVAFPSAFATVGIALHLPLLLVLVGIVLRGAAFVFRAYDPQRTDETTGIWRLVFAVSSTVTPVMLGVSFATVSTGALALDPVTRVPTGGFVDPWLAPYPLAVGLFFLAITAFLSAIYLVLETPDPELKADLRRRALWSAAAVGFLAFASLALARTHAPVLWQGLTARTWSLPFQLLTGLLAVATIASVATRRDQLARVLAAGQVVLLVVGWAASQWPYLIVADLTLAAAAAPDSVLRPVVFALGVGMVVLIPAYGWLYSVFKAPTLPGQEAR